ncbi:MAG: hypothetical protein AAGA56_02315 [Myxococcota bacterium]
MNRSAYDPSTGKYAAHCSTDFNEAAQGGIGAYVFRMEDGDAQEFHYMHRDGLRSKGGASSIVARDGGGFLTLLVGVNDQVQPAGYPDEPPTAIGIARWSAEGTSEGPVQWVVQNPTHYLSYATLVPIAPNRYLLGWGLMTELGPGGEPFGDAAYRVPWEYWVVEIDEEGQQLTEPMMLEGAGWGEVDEMAPLGQGRAGWAYIHDPTLSAEGEAPSCTQDTLQLSVYTSPLP